MQKSISCFHGSDLEIISEKYGIDQETIINFSGNVNPLGISPSLRTRLQENIDLIASYPDRQYKALRQSISQYIKAPIENILVGNGTTELISLVINNIRPKKALIIGPTYSEYEKELSLNDADIHYYRLHENLDFCLDVKELENTLAEDFDLLIICNPNNPTGSVIDNDQMRQVLEHCKELGIYVLVDETYIEFVQVIQKISAVSFCSTYTNLVILRGVSKFFSAPGLRLGYCVCGNEILRMQINEKKNPWTINALASLAGEIMLQDTNYIEETRKLIHDERERICKRLSTWTSVKIYYPHANFMLLQLLNQKITSHTIFENLIQEGIMIRDASSFPFLDSRFIRFCFLDRRHNDLLLNQLALLLGEENHRE